MIDRHVCNGLGFGFFNNEIQVGKFFYPLVSDLSQTLPASYVHGVNPRLDYFIHARAISILNTAAHAKQINEPLLCLEQTMQETC